MPVQAKAQDNVRIRRVARTEKRQVKPPKSTGVIDISLRGNGPLPDRDFLFEPVMKGIYAPFVDANFNSVSVRNDSISPLVIPHRYRVGSVIDFKAKESYPIELENHSLATKAS